MEPRVASNIQVKAIQRIVEAQGNFVAVIARGDPISGSILIIGRVRSQIPVIYERFPNMDGGYEWQISGPKSAESENDVNAWLEKRRSRDPDIWLLELDVASDEQLAELTCKMG